MKNGCTFFDVIVVGAGPVGSVTAELLAQRSLRVALLEEHPAVGLPNHCSGLVSPRALECAGLAEELVGLARFHRARVWGPGGRTLWLEADTLQAIAIDRPRFDRLLAARAAQAGALLMPNTRAERFERSHMGVRVVARHRGRPLELRAALLIGADGAGSRVARWMGTARPPEVVPAMKAEVAFYGRGCDTIEIFLGRRVAPGWFGWVIPLPDGTARIGLGARSGLKDCFARFLELVRQRCGDFALLGEVRAAPLPLGPARGFVAERALLVGAAAAQTKPTTGGGIYFGLRAARLAATTAAAALAAGDGSHARLAGYERAWQRADGGELAWGRWLRRGFVALPDPLLDLALGLLDRAWGRERLARLGDMDYPSWLVRPPAALNGPEPAGRAEHWLEGASAGAGS